MPATNLSARFAAAMDALPLVANLCGVAPHEAEAIGKGLYATGFRLIEVPLNSPDPFASIASIRRALPDDALVGAGTVLAVEQLASLQACGGQLAVMPHADPTLIRAAKAAGLLCVPGVVTPSEAFTALAAGADALKLFPAELITPPILKAMRVVLPKVTRLLPVGGITGETMQPYLDAGAARFVLGSALYAPGMSCAQVVTRGEGFVAAWKSRNTIS